MDSGQTIIFGSRCLLGQRFGSGYLTDAANSQNDSGGFFGISENTPANMPVEARTFGNPGAICPSKGEGAGLCLNNYAY